MDAIISLLSASIRIMTPYLFGALGASYAARAGVINMAIEGLMLGGAFTGFVVAYFSGNTWLGVLGAIIAGALLSLIFAFVAITVGANPVVTGTIISLISTGLTGYLFIIFFGRIAILGVTGLEKVPIPFLSNIPILGELLFSNSMLTYIAFIIVPISWWFFFKTPKGLSVRAVGESTEMAASLGVPVKSIKYIFTILSGALCGLGGAFLTLDLVSTYLSDGVAGKGYLSLAAMVLGKKHPLGVAMAAFVFGFAEALQIRLQTYGFSFIPLEFIQMLPYIAAILAMFASSVKTDNRPRT